MGSKQQQNSGTIRKGSYRKLRKRKWLQVMLHKLRAAFFSDEGNKQPDRPAINSEESSAVSVITAELGVSTVTEVGTRWCGTLLHKQPADFGVPNCRHCSSHASVKCAGFPWPTDRQTDADDLIIITSHIDVLDRSLLQHTVAIRSGCGVTQPISSVHRDEAVHLELNDYFSEIKKNVRRKNQHWCKQKDSLYCNWLNTIQ